MARPRIEAAQRRTHQVGVRVTAAEAAAIRAAAQRAGEPPVEWLRRLALEAAGAPAPSPPVAERERLERWRSIWQELRRVGANLNQVARRMNAGERVGGEELLAALQDVRAVVDREVGRWSPGQ